MGGKMGAQARSVAALLERARDLVAEVVLEFETEGVARENAEIRAVIRQLEDYLLPRLNALDAPWLAVIGVSAGAGKSTILNSILGADVSTAGVLRPTTRVPVLVCAEADRDWFSG